MAKQTKSATTQNEAVVNNSENVATATETTPTVEATMDVAGDKIPGRPVDPGSARQQRLLDMEVKRQLNGGTLHRGRPSNPDSARQQRLSTKDPNAKPGRPRMSDDDKIKAENARKERATKAAAVLAEKAKEIIAAKQAEVPAVQA